MSPITGGFKLDTINDILPKYLYLPGRTGGQVIGANPHTGGNLTDIALEGRLLLGDITGVNFTPNTIIKVNFAPTISNATGVNISASVNNFNTISGTFSPLSIVMSGTPTVTGTFTSIRGFNFTATLGINSGTTVTELIAGFYNIGVGIYAGTLSQLTIARFSTNGASSISGGATCPTLTGIEIAIGTRNIPVTNIRGLWFKAPASASYAATNTFKVIDIDPGIGNNISITNWYGCYIDVPVNPVNKWGYYQKNPDALNVYEGDSIYGALATPNSTVDNQGSQALKITANKTAAYTAAKETIIPCDANTVGAFAVTLPTAVGIPGRIYIIKKVDASANAVTVTPAGAETIDGAATVVLNVQWQVTRIVSNGVNWLIW